MPTLFRFVTLLLVLGGLGFSGMLALAYLVEPEPREMKRVYAPGGDGGLKSVTIRGATSRVKRHSRLRAGH